jgi:hypothetical protein
MCIPYLHQILLLLLSLLLLWNGGSLFNIDTSIWPPLWSSGQSSCPQIQRPGFDSRRYQIIWEVVGLERDPLSLVSTTEELLEIKSNGSGLENRDYGHKDSSRWQRGTLYPQQLTLTSSISGGRSVGIVRSRTQTMEFLRLIWENNIKMSAKKSIVMELAQWPASERGLRTAEFY